MAVCESTSSKNHFQKYKLPLGVSIVGTMYLAKKVVITASVRYDKFNYKPLDKRIGEYRNTKWV